MAACASDLPHFSYDALIEAMISGKTGETTPSSARGADARLDAEESPDSAYARRTDRHMGEARAAAGLARSMGRDMDFELRDLELEMMSLTRDLVAIRDAVPGSAEVAEATPEPEPGAPGWDYYSLLDQQGHATLFSFRGPLGAAQPWPVATPATAPGPARPAVPSLAVVAWAPGEDLVSECAALAAFHSARARDLGPDGGLPSSASGETPSGSAFGTVLGVPEKGFRFWARSARKDLQAVGSGMPVLLGKEAQGTGSAPPKVDPSMRSLRTSQQRADLYMPYASAAFHLEPPALSKPVLPSAPDEDDSDSEEAVAERDPGCDACDSDEDEVVEAELCSYDAVRDEDDSDSDETATERFAVEAFVSRTGKGLGCGDSETSSPRKWGGC